MMDSKDKMKLLMDYELYRSVQGSKYEVKPEEIQDEYKLVAGSQGIELQPHSVDFYRSHPLDDRRALNMLDYLKHEQKYMTPPESKQKMSADPRYIYAPIPEHLSLSSPLSEDHQ